MPVLGWLFEGSIHFDGLDLLPLATHLHFVGTLIFFVCGFFVSWEGGDTKENWKIENMVVWIFRRLAADVSSNRLEERWLCGLSRLLG